MTTSVFAAVLLAAMLHAGWNAIVKGGADKLAGMAGVVLGHALPAVGALILCAPIALESLPWLSLSAALHLGYQSFLLMAYRVGDLSHVYPLARGSAPLIVALVSTTLLGVALSAVELAAVGLIGAGILSIALVRARHRPADPRAATFALLTGLFIAGYSLVDGTGARLSGSPVAFFAWSALLTGAAFAALVARRRPGLLRRLPRRSPGAFWIGGPASFAAYGLVVWGFTQAPIALVTALRETSIVFALLIGALVLRERIDAARIASTFVTLAGVVLLRLAKA